MASLRGLSGKGEFETTASFQTRLNSQVTGKLDRTLIIGKDPEDRKYFEYDADNKLLRIRSWAFSNKTFLFYDALQKGNALAATQMTIGYATNVGVVISRNEQVVGRYVASNAYGATVDVVKVQWTTTAIFDRPAYHFGDQPPGDDLFPGADKQSYVLGQLRLEPVEAQRIKSGLKVGFVVLPRPPYMVSGSHHPITPTRNNPQDVTEG